MMTFRKAAVAVLVLSGCAGPSGASNGASTSGALDPVSSSDGLTRCFGRAYGEADVEAAFAQCEEKYYGTAWRTQAPKGPRASKDGFVEGFLDPQLVQAGVQVRLGKMRECYHAGLTRDPSLRGDFRVRFIVDTTGRASQVEDAGSHMRDKQVLSCVLSEFSALRFPRPQGGAATVVYPLVISPGDV